MARNTTTTKATAAEPKQPASRAKKPSARAPAGGSQPADGRARAVIDGVRPRIDGGRYPVKRIVGEDVRVEADIFTDGHDHLGCVLQWRRPGEEKWREAPMHEHPNDLWGGHFEPTEMGAWEYRVLAWVDHFHTWQMDLRKRVDAGQDVGVDLGIGAGIIRDTTERLKGGETKQELTRWADHLVDGGTQAERAAAAMSDELAGLMWSASPRLYASESAPLRIDAERPKAQYSAWYELFPRSASPEPDRHGTLGDVAARLPYVAEMGFDVLYLPPIHPIGTTKRKGKNNKETADDGDVGSPWAIGSEDGGHDAIHPELGTFDDFAELIVAAEAHGIEVALDLAFQCSPDHPYVRAHPEWFHHRPDGSIQYAENPPKKYQDIYPLNFECEDWKALWDELLRVTLFWVEKGVKILRVDNPHTKPFAFWDWLIAEVRAQHPEVIFLSEAFTPPKKMYRLAKGGFSQSYTYFAWRREAWELRQYMEELSRPPVCDLFRPNFWPNTPDILTDQLQGGGRNAAMARLVLAATLSSSYGIYGPAFELCDFTPREPGSEETLHSEKYQQRHWDLDDPNSLRYFIGLVNRIRRGNAALHQFRDITFHHCDNPAHLAYSKRDPSGENVVLCVVNTDPHAERWGLVRLDLRAMGVGPGEAFDVEDLLSGCTYRWTVADNSIGLPAGHSHIFRVTLAGHSERTFETWA